jgi:hypothetical protein
LSSIPSTAEREGGEGRGGKEKKERKEKRKEKAVGETQEQGSRAGLTGNNLTQQVHSSPRRLAF